MVAKEKSNKSRMIKSLPEFKEMAVLTHDNHEIASTNWLKTWGGGYWFNLWCYKEYTLKGLRYRTGQVLQYGNNRSVSKFYNGNNEVTQQEFLKLIRTIKYK